MRRLLVIRLGALGDLLHASASVVALKAAQPDVEVHWLTSPLYQDFVASLPGVAQVHVLDKKAGWPGLLQVAAQLRVLGLEGVVNLHPSLKTWVLSQLAAPKRQAVYRKEKLNVKGQAQRTITRRHATADFFEPFRRLFNLEELPALLPHWPMAEDSSIAKSPGERWVGIIPGVGGKRSNRAWEPDSYVALIQMLSGFPEFVDLKIKLIGGPDERGLAESLMAKLSTADKTDALTSRVENCCGVYDFFGTAALLRQCDWVIGGDTGPMHLAAAVDTPLIGIYGPTSWKRTGPVGEQPIQAVLPPEDLACWPCELADCPYVGDAHLACMKQILPQQVLQASQRVLTESKITKKASL